MDVGAAKRCSKCGAVNPPDARFCGSCGNLLTSSLEREAGPVKSLGVSHGVGEPTAAEVEHPATELADSEPAPEPIGDSSGSSAAVTAEPVRSEEHKSKPARPTVDPNMPGAGLAPDIPIPPPPQQRQSFPPRDAANQPVANQAPAPYAAAYEEPHYQVPPPGYGYSLPSDGNTSGMGAGYPVPDCAKGWSFAGVVPYGLFSFINGSPLWGALGLIGSIIGIVGLVYFFYIGFEGKQLAWRSRRFDSIQQYMDTMRIWNNWGIGLIVAELALFMLLAIAYVVIFATAFNSAMSGY